MDFYCFTTKHHAHYGLHFKAMQITSVLPEQKEQKINIFIIILRISMWTATEIGLGVIRKVKSDDQLLEVI
jgi:hypothetical protein